MVEGEKEILKAGAIAKEVKEFARKLVKKDMLLLEIAEKIEDKIRELGGEPAFPCNLSVNEIAAHYTPSYNDESVAHGLLKVDFGVHIDGYVADTAFSVDLEGSEENKMLIEASKKALERAINSVKKFGVGVKVCEIGRAIEESIKYYGFYPIVNLSGHQIEQYDLHAGLTIPNIYDGRADTLSSGLYAIEPFATSGSGKIHDGKPSGIYSLIDPKNVRSPIAREILNFIAENYVNLPFCSRWLVKEFGTKALIGIRQLEMNGNIHHYNQLIESAGKPVSQTENTILLKESGEVVVTSE